MTHHTERFGPPSDEKGSPPEEKGLPSDEKPRSVPEARRTTQPRPVGGPQQAAPPSEAPDRQRNTAAPGSQLSAGPERGGTRMPGTEATGRDATSAAAKAPSGVRPTDGAEGAHTDRSLLPPEGRDALSQRMQQAVTDFVENPRHAVEEADSAFDRIVADLTEALEERRRELRASWKGEDAAGRTEELRLALQRYRDSGEQLLRI